MRFFVLSFLFCTLALAQPKFGTLNAPVIDLAGLLHSSDKELLGRNIYEIHAQGGPQVGIYIADDLQGYAVEDFSIRLAEAWKLGGDKKDNGLIILIAPKDRKLRIEVGGGIEGDITDLEASRWVTSILQPAFRDQAYALGLNTVLFEVAGKFNIKLEGKTFAKRVRRQKNELSPLATLILLVILIFVLPIISRARGGVVHYGGGRGGFGGGRGGFGGGGFGGGGGWGGGGGGFSGGGASGSW